jgi:hypothetical protein
MEKKTWVLLIVAAVVFISIILYLLYLVFKALAMLVSSYLATVIFLIIIIYILRAVIRILVFPGTSVFFRKMVEYNIRNSMTRIMLHTILEFKYALEEIQDSTVQEENVETLVDNVHDLKKMIESLLLNNARQLQLGTLTKYQEEFQHKVEDLKQTIISIRTSGSSSESPNSLWNCTWDEIEPDELVGCEITCNLHSKIQDLDEFCKHLGSISDIDHYSFKESSELKSESIYQKLKHKIFVYYFNSSHGTIDQARVELEKKFKGQQEFIKMKDGTNIFYGRCRGNHGL